MDAMCIDKDGKFKLCPYRVFTKEIKAIAIGQGDCTIQEFYPCVGEACIAYHVGLCMRVKETISGSGSPHE